MRQQRVSSILLEMLRPRIAKMGSGGKMRFTTLLPAPPGFSGNVRGSNPRLARPARATIVPHIMRLGLNADIWNLLHDGTIVRAVGTVPGDVRLSISIDYLRRRFPDVGELVLLTLHECTSFAYDPDDPAGRITDLQLIATAKPEILKAEDWTDPNRVYCVSGTLRVVASAFSLALDNGRSINFDELASVSEAYWKGDS